LQLQVNNRALPVLAELALPELDFMYYTSADLSARHLIHNFLSFSTFLFLLAGAGYAQTTGTVGGKVTLIGSGAPLHNVVVTISPLNLSVETSETGEFELRDVPSGRWSLLAHLDGFPDVVRTISVSSGQTSIANFEFKLTGIRDQVTVSASGSEQSTFEAFQSVSSLDNVDLALKGSPSLGEVLDKQPGVAKRSFGPGSSRPIVRGFDGDRVLVLQDGMQSGSIGSQSGDHGEPIDVLSLERLEVVKGPAALLYGSNAIGGVVNAITRHNERPHRGLRGYVTGIGGTNNHQAGGSSGIEYGTEKFIFWGNGSGQRLGDYEAPQIGRIINSTAQSGSGTGGTGYFGEKSYITGSYTYDWRRYGIPFAGEIEGEPDAQIDLKMRRHAGNVNFGFTNLNWFVENFRVSLNYSDYQHQEIEIEDGEESIGTLFNNDVFVMRGVAQQQRRGALSGSFGFWLMNRQYESIGAEALAPRTTQRAIAAFGLEEFSFNKFALQFGGRLEHNRYSPVTGEARNFTGFSGAAGIRVPLWEGGAIVANYNHNYRAPALEELYNNGPHPGNLTVEIGNLNLQRERSDGIELSLRHQANNVRAEAAYFYYNLRDFIFLAPTGNIEDGLPEAEYQQADSRYRGTELRLDLRLHSTLWLNTGLDYVNAELKNTRQGLPRIPPLRGRLGLDFNYKGFGLRPEIVMAQKQDRIFSNETTTAGYTVFNLDASYTITGPHAAHIFAVNSFNLGNRLYRNHSSFIKDLAPEIGRGVRFVYTLRFF
jgi:iron complex outermembrane receptor protein